MRYPWSPARYQMLGAASQIPLLFAGGATEGNATDNALMVVREAPGMVLELSP